MILQESSNPFELKTWLQISESQSGSEPAKRESPTAQKQSPTKFLSAYKRGFLTSSCLQRICTNLDTLYALYSCTDETSCGYTTVSCFLL